jgi:hypothetical protein
MFFTSPPMQPSALMTMAGQSTAVLRCERLSSKFIMGACLAISPSNPLQRVGPGRNKDELVKKDVALVGGKELQEVCQIA